MVSYQVGCTVWWEASAYDAAVRLVAQRGTLLDPPFAMPGGIVSPNNPVLNGAMSTHPNSRGLEAMALAPDRKYLYAALEGATLVDPNQSRRYIFEFSTGRRAFTGRVLQYQTENRRDRTLTDGTGSPPA